MQNFASLSSFVPPVADFSSFGNFVVHCATVIASLAVAFKRRIMKATFFIALAKSKTNVAKASNKNAFISVA